MTGNTETASKMNALHVRERLIEALRLDLVGPTAGHELAEEHLLGWERPSNWYLTGFLVPADAPMGQRGDDDEDEDFGETPEEAGLSEEESDDGRPAKKGFFPSSLGLSFLIDAETDELYVTVRWGDYRPAKAEDFGYERDRIWVRTPREEHVPLDLSKAAGGTMKESVPNAGGLELEVSVRMLPPGGLDGLVPPGTRSVSVFLVNRRQPSDDQSYAFQAELEIAAPRSFVPRPDPRGTQAEDWDDRVAHLHYADTPEFAVGHGVSADWELVDGQCRLLRSTWLPLAQVERTETQNIRGVELSMEALGQLPDGDAATAALSPLVDEYRRWIQTWTDKIKAFPDGLRPTAEDLLAEASVACERIQRGIDMLAADPDALDAFRVANRAVGAALKRRIKDLERPSWRAFQLAFILLNLPGLIDPEDGQREIVDLLFFPTGGGKTEAYLGLAAFAIVLRRLRRPDAGGRGGAGVAVIMRYTLRLLTLDQLGRAAGLMCGLELERERDPARYGEWPFEIGLWVGKAATPNVMGRKNDGRSDTALRKTNQFKANPRGKPSPIPLEECPWCQTPFEPDSFHLEPNADKPTNLRITCSDIDCDFNGARPLPIVAIDEPLYRRLPAFLIATVDKFATLPWIGPSGALLGGADRWDASGFYGPAEPGKGQKLPNPLMPPDLIIQDELHLISGPLGTMTGLYETAIDALCSREADGRTIRPKVVASTATVRQAQEQIHALFARAHTKIFPPPGPDRRDSFFARTVSVEEAPARLYAGVAAPGRNPKVAFRRAWLALMGAAQRAYLDEGGERNKDNPADPYMTVLGYFNSLRELGGARRILEEEIQNTIKDYGRRRRLNERPGLFRERLFVREVLELTSRVSTNEVAEARRRLAAPFYDTKLRVDSAIATNMISVGLDIQRLGLMVVFGQPKTTSEYIQATSRVGRDVNRPGLVVTLLNVHKPRDRSHYERFRHYHETFYRSVEVASVTPFAARAIDRGFAGTLVSLARHTRKELAVPRGVARMGDVRADLEQLLLATFRERLQQQPFVSEQERVERERAVQNRIVALLDDWQKIVERYHENGEQIQYQKYEMSGPKPLLRGMLEREFDMPEQQRFRVVRSLRDVEPDVNLYIRSLE